MVRHARISHIANHDIVGVKTFCNPGLFGNIANRDTRYKRYEVPKNSGTGNRLCVSACNKKSPRALRMKPYPLGRNVLRPNRTENRPLRFRASA